LGCRIFGVFRPMVTFGTNWTTEFANASTYPHTRLGWSVKDWVLCTRWSGRGVLEKRNSYKNCEYKETKNPDHINSVNVRCTK
jgi:hypothetical protein